MNFDSPSHLVKNIQQQFFGGSPDSPSLATAAAGRTSKRATNHLSGLPLSTKSINTQFHYDSARSNHKSTKSVSSSYNYTSPGSTLIADISENFHIEDDFNRSIPTPKRSLNFSTAQEQDRVSELLMQEELELEPSPLFSKRDSISKFQQPQFKPPFIDENSSSRTTSNSSISSIHSMSSFSSVESSATSISLNALNNQMITKNAFSSTIMNSGTLRRTKTSISGNRVLHSLSGATLDFNNEFMNTNLESDDSDENGDALDKLCVESPTVSKILVIDNKEDEDDLFCLNKREIGSPIQKKPIRSKVRRIHSMFYSKKEITDTTTMFGNLMSSPNNQASPEDDSTLSNSLLKKSKIETFQVKNDSIPRINVDTLCKILDGSYSEFFNEVTIVDCRFEYEYNGGHINGAVNVSSQRELEEKFLNKDSVPRSKSNKSFTEKQNNLIVFHCEFSSYRGPLMASHLRTCDRNVNQDNYPHLDYPDILILEGGYKTFFDSQSHRCYPQKYVEMNDHNHKNVCEKELTRFRRDLKKASSFNSLSFAASHSSTVTTVTSTTVSSSQRRHRRTLTSGTINFARRPSLKGQLLDFRRSTTDINEHANSEDENKPPESLNFGFKFPLPKNDNDEADQQKQVIKKKLSRSLTYYK